MWNASVFPEMTLPFPVKYTLAGNGSLAQSHWVHNHVGFLVSIPGQTFPTHFQTGDLGRIATAPIRDKCMAFVLSRGVFREAMATGKSTLGWVPVGHQK